MNMQNQNNRFFCNFCIKMWWIGCWEKG